MLYGESEKDWIWFYGWNGASSEGCEEPVALRTLLGQECSWCQLTSITASNREYKWTVSEIFMIITCSYRCLRKDMLCDQKCHQGNKVAFALMNFPRFWVWNCFPLRSLMYSADKEGMYLWEEAGEENTLGIYLHKNANLQWEMWYQETWAISFGMAITSAFP